MAAHGNSLRPTPKALEVIGAHLSMLRERIRNTTSRVDSISARAFGVVEEIQSERGLGPLNASEPAGSIPLLMKLCKELDEQVSLLNKSLDKLETLA